MREEHQTCQGSTMASTQNADEASTRLNAPSPLSQLQIKLRLLKPTPLPDPFQFSVYLAQLASPEQAP
jgi:hypothetical protein